ncbi:hypothetical protein PIB30_028290, partial [Stylosanthes scabra]|nr:hypothetical protein [Stylosanthes scabra]
ETIPHCLVTCSRAHCVWQLSGLSIPPIQDLATLEDWHRWWLLASSTAFHNHQGRKTISFLATLLWKIWNVRNKKAFENLDLQSQEIFASASQLNEEFFLRAV